jgi:hypothetical protein
MTTDAFGDHPLTHQLLVKRANRFFDFLLAARKLGTFTAQLGDGSAAAASVAALRSALPAIRTAAERASDATFSTAANTSGE